MTVLSIKEGDGVRTVLGTLSLKTGEFSKVFIRRPEKR